MGAIQKIINKGWVDEIPTGKELDRAVAELAAYDTLVKAARHMVNELPDYSIDLARVVIGNTNANCIVAARDKLAAALEPFRSDADEQP